ncbi:hypothetical protein, partial [Citrobacter sp. JGM124]|uniref:hypothetical protein n=1 Tax=Citrobacter sp. JGM124 TaxID=2799789 RepID=UPI001BA8B7CF
EVKRRSADGSVGSPHARVGNCQASNKQEPRSKDRGFLRLWPLRTFIMGLILQEQGGRGGYEGACVSM